MSAPIVDLTAAEIVALAKEAAHSASPLSQWWDRKTPMPWLHVLGPAEYLYGQDEDVAGGWIMRAPLSPENAASEAALVRVLVASKITVHYETVRNGDDSTYVGEWYAAIGNKFAVGDTEAEARDALLDVLLGAGVASHNCEAVGGEGPCAAGCGASR